MKIWEAMDIKELLAFNAKLQKKKNALRKELSAKGVLKREGFNTYDKYSYFSEAQYKELFTGLLYKHNLELAFTETEYSLIEGTEKQSNGRLVKLLFTLTDCETGYYEETEITGEGIDKGDKAGYKAYTGAIKYYLANTFLVATGDDAEKAGSEEEETAKGNMNTKKPVQKGETPCTDNQAKYIFSLAGEEGIKQIITKYNIADISELTKTQASELIKRLRANK